MTSTRTIWTLTTAFALACTTARAQQISETRIRELVQQAAEQAARGGAAAEQPAPPGQARPVVRLTLDDAILWLRRKLRRREVTPGGAAASPAIGN